MLYRGVRCKKRDIIFMVIEMTEIWKDIKNYEGLYQVSNLGRVKSLRRNKVLSPSLTTKKEYLGVSLCKNGKPKRFMVHHLVAEHFIPNPDGYKIINHKDENKTNNKSSNLEWCTQSYNIKYSNKNSKKVYQYSLDGKFIKEWRSSYQAMQELKLPSRQGIDECCKEKRNKSYGYIWKYGRTD